MGQADIILQHSMKGDETQLTARISAVSAGLSVFFSALNLSSKTNGVGLSSGMLV